MLFVEIFRCQNNNKDPEGIMRRWTEDFTNLFVNPFALDDTTIDNLPHNQMNTLSTVRDVKLAIKNQGTCT